MFKPRQLDKLVDAGIITPTQKLQILDFDNDVGHSWVYRILMTLGIFTLGVGVISIVAANWQDIGDMVKLIIMLLLLLFSAFGVLYYLKQNKTKVAEKWALSEFLFSGAAIGLIIQVFQLSGGKIYAPLGVWALMTASLLFLPKQKLISYFWMPLFLTWAVMWIGDIWWDIFESFDCVLLFFAGLVALGKFLDWRKPNFFVGDVLFREALICLYLCLAFYIIAAGFDSHEGLMVLFKSFLYVGVFAVCFVKFKQYRIVRSFVKLAGLAIVMLYINFGERFGLFETGIGLMISGALLIAALVFLPKFIRRVLKEKIHA